MKDESVSCSGAAVAPTDEALAAAARQGDTFAEEELVRRYTPTVYAFTRNCYRNGWERADFVQEGMFGLIRAIREYDAGKGVPFSAFAAVCIRTELLTALRRALSFRHFPLTDYVSLSSSDGGSGVQELLSEDSEAMFDRILSGDEISSLLSSLNDVLSPFERKVLSAYLKGFGIGEVAGALGRSHKSVENAVSRIRRKASDIYRAKTSG